MRPINEEKEIKWGYEEPTLIVMKMDNIQILSESDPYQIPPGEGDPE